MIRPRYELELAERSPHGRLYHLGKPLSIWFLFARYDKAPWLGSHRALYLE
jgi:hypothetical protein